MNKKILLISNKVFHYRVPVYNHLVDRLRKRGYDFTVLTNQVESRGSEPNFTIRQMPFGFRAYRNAVVEADPAAVILFLHIKDLFVWPLLAWIKLRKMRVIYWNHGINLQTPNNTLKGLIFRIFHKAADAIVLYSANEKKYIARKYWAKVFIANNTLNFNSFPLIEESAEDIKRELEVPFEKVVLFVGRITPSKRLDDLIEAAKYLDSNTGVVIVGGGLTLEQARCIKSSMNIRYLGEIYESRDVNKIFKMSDVFSIPGKMGLGINQAFYWGLPVVTEKVKHSPEIIYLKDGENGFVVEADDVRKLAEKINYLLSSEDIYKRFSRAAKAEITANANIDRMCDGFIEAIHFVDT